MDLDRFPRVALAHLPTPLEPLERLSRHLGGPRLFIKRDDCTGLAFGGNKTRKLEFLLAEAIEAGGLEQQYTTWVHDVLNERRTRRRYRQAYIDLLT